MRKCDEHLVYDFAYQAPKWLSAHAVSQSRPEAPGQLRALGLARDQRRLLALQKDDDGTNESDAEREHRGEEGLDGRP